MAMIWIYGAGACGRTASELALASGHVIAGFIDDDPARAGTTVASAPVHVRSSATPDLLAGQHVVCAIGNAQTRSDAFTWFDAIGAIPITLIHPTAVVSPSASIGRGSLIHAMAVIWAGVVLGEGVMISPGARVAHDASIGACSLVSLGALVGSSLTIGERALVGMGAVVSTGVSTIGDDALIGAGSVVVRDVPAATTVAGNPAHAMRSSR